MRLDIPFTTEDFERGLAEALDGGGVNDCSGLNEELWDAFTRIAEAENPTEPLIELARAAFERAKKNDPKRFAE